MKKKFSFMAKLLLALVLCCGLLFSVKPDQSVSAAKMTNKKALEYVVNNYKDMPADVKAKVEAMIASLDKKSGGNRKPTATQIENESYKTTILEILTTDGMTASEVIKSHSDFDGMSNQKMSALLKQLVDSGKVTKVKDKKSTIFKLVA